LQTCKLALDVLEEVAKRAKTVTFGTGEAIITQGEKGDAFYILCKVGTGETLEGWHPQPKDRRGRRRP
jgi:CRP-like cAMP-binding protein